jgi:hypothetical protein
MLTSAPDPFVLRDLTEQRMRITVFRSLVPQYGHCVEEGEGNVEVCMLSQLLGLVEHGLDLLNFYFRVFGWQKAREGHLRKQAP